MASPTPNSTNPTAKHKGRQWRRLIRIEKAAFLTQKGIYSNDQIANFIGIHPQTLIYLKQTPEFQSRMIALATGVIDEHDITIREDEDYQREELKSMVPVALMKLRELAMSGNQSVALKATQDILDRDGTHAKVSRSQIDIKEKIDLNVLDQVAASIQDVLRNAPKLPPSENDSGADNEVIGEFTKGATDSQSQIYLMEEQINKDTLEDIDVKRLRVN